MIVGNVKNVFIVLVLVCFSRAVFCTLDPCDPTAPFGFVELMQTIDAQLLSIKDEAIDCLDKIKADLTDTIAILGIGAGAGLATQPCSGGGGTTPPVIPYGDPGNEVTDYVDGFTQSIEKTDNAKKLLHSTFATVAKYRLMQRRMEDQRRALG